MSNIFEREFIRGIERLVARKFEEALRTLPDEMVEAPFTGDRFDPHDPEQFDFHKKRAVRALLFQHWFEGEGPKWMQPLPVKLADCSVSAGIRRGLNDRRAQLMSGCAWDVRSKGYHIDRATPFEVFCAQQLAG
jgi:hypothetical protein